MSSVVLLDGGMGQELVHRHNRKAAPLWSTQVMLDAPHLVQELHEDFIRAGASIITLNAYAATPERLAMNGMTGQFAALQRRACQLARAARHSSGVPVSIAGCLPPLVASYRPGLAPEFEVSRSIYSRLVAAQAAHVDLFLCETLSSVREVQAATQAAAESGLPVWTALTVKDQNGLILRSGERLEAGVEAAYDSGASAVLVNCSWPEAVDQGLAVLARSGLPFGAYANGFTGVQALQANGSADVLRARQDLDPHAYAHRAMQWVARGASIVGGCCEISPAHIGEIATSLLAAGYHIGATLGDEIERVA